MAIIAKAGATFTPCPAGSHIAVCCDVVDLGLIETNYKGQKPKKQHKIKIVWQTPEIRDDGKPFLVSKRYTNSLHEKAALRKDLEAWRGRSFTDEELQGFDVETVISVGCMLGVIHNASGGTIYANVSSLMKLPRGMTAPAIDPAYIRVADRPVEDEENAVEGSDSGDWQVSDDDCPF